MRTRRKPPVLGFSVASVSVRLGHEQHADLQVPRGDAPARIRTWDLRIRSPPLYPAELQGPPESVDGLRARIGSRQVIALAVAFASTLAAQGALAGAAQARGLCVVPGVGKPLDRIWRP